MIDPNLKNARILIVDDQEANIEVLASLLHLQGYENIKSTQDPRKVVGLYSSFDPDLILLDLSMPYLSGFEVMDQLKALVPSNTFLPILVLTADVTFESKQKALSGGAIDFLTKPFDITEVGLRIKNLLYTIYLQKQLINQNQELESKVKERTYELEKQNIELIIAKEKAEASDRLKSAFINNISHEIRTPLNGILGFGQILTEENLTQEEKQAYSEMLSQSSLRLINTMTNIMDIAMLSSGNLKVYENIFDPEKSMNEVVSKFDKECEQKGVSLNILPSPFQEKIKIQADSELFYKILFQLVDNAVKFTHRGSITLGFEYHTNEIHFFVKDTGIGISEEKKAQVFDSFTQEDNAMTRKYEGNGLGLTIAKGLAEILKGRMWLSSEKGVGSVFYFSIPYVRHEVSDDNPKEIKDSTQTPTILIAEDDESNFVLVRAMLYAFKLHIIRAEDGLQAIELAKQHPEVGIVLMDLKMPELDGFEATRRIKEFRADLPIIALTAYSSSDDKELALKSGCNDFLTKPIKKDLLLAKLREYIAI